MVGAIASDVGDAGAAIDFEHVVVGSGVNENLIAVAACNGDGVKAIACLDFASLSTANGVRTGCYTSPHLVDFRERIKIDGEPMSESALTEGWERVRDFVMERQMTFFEATTLIALEYFVEPSVVPCGPPQVVPIFTL